MSSKKNPSQELQRLASDLGVSVDSHDFANAMDGRDPLKDFRAKFQVPKKKDLPAVISAQLSEQELEEECVYLGGNSLGLKPHRADELMKQQMDIWGKIALAMHFAGTDMPAALCDLPGRRITAQIVGAKKETEVAIMNGLTVNLHLMLAAFYKPQGKRSKLVIEAHAFPSDRYAAKSVVGLHGLNPEVELVQLGPREGEHTLRTEDIVKYIEDHGDEVALILLPGIQYYTGQKFDMKRITKVGRDKGCFVGWDLAHAVGNVALELHDWDVDFACWCSYKYLNSGAGGIAGIFLHERYEDNPPNNLHGWWSNKEETRFNMDEQVDLAKGAGAFRLSNPPPWLACLNMASLEIFEEAGMERILQKEYLLTGFLELLINKFFGPASGNPVQCSILTPKDPDQRGAQLSLSFSVDTNQAYQAMKAKGVVCDFRSPNVVRVAPAPLYNSFKDVFNFIKILKSLFACNV